MQQKGIMSVEEICQKLRPLFGEKIDKIYFNYVTTESRETKDEIASMLHVLYQKNFNQLLEGTTHLEPPRKEDVTGTYHIGDVMYGGKEIYPFSLREHDMPRHVCVSGMSGSGKTTLAFNILESFIAKDKPFLVFDWKKSFRPLLVKDPSMTCFTIGDSRVTNNFKINLNKPPKGVAPKEWIVVICDLIAESFFVSYGVHKILLETLDESFKEWGVYNGSENYPTWHHIKWRLEEKLEKSKSRAQGWIESALRVATVLTFGDFGGVLNYKGDETISIEDILQKRVIFELNSLGNIEKKFFCELILMYLYKLKKAQQNRVNELFSYAVLVDEAHNIFLKDKTKFTSESVTDMVYRELREYGVSLICLDQHLSKLSDTVKGNSACHIAFQQQLPEDIESVSRLMQLHDKKELFSRLPIGKAVVRLSERYAKPFFISVRQNEGREIVVLEEEMKERVKRFHLKQMMHQSQNLFTKQVIQGGSFTIEDLFTQIDLPKELDLYAKRIQRVNTENNTSNPMRDTIFATIRRRLTQGEDLASIEKDMVSLYDPTEVSFAMNQFLEAELRKKKSKAYKESVTTTLLSQEVKEETPIYKTYEPPKSSHIDDEKQTIEADHNSFKVSSIRSNDKLSAEESKFLAFLSQNPDHTLTTVNLYKTMGFSPRKGNKIKTQLQDKALIVVKEITHDKGWKKIITLA